MEAYSEKNKTARRMKEKSIIQQELKQMYEDIRYMMYDLEDWFNTDYEDLYELQTINDEPWD